MNIAVVGSKERDTEEDRQLVSSLLEQLVLEAPHSVFVTALSHIGVGRFVRDKCLEKDNAGRYRFALIECTVRIYAASLSKSELSQIYLARNATPFETADMLIYLASEDRRGTMEDLLDRFTRAGRPTLVLMPGENLPDKIFPVAVVTVAPHHCDDPTCVLCV
jgi:hypothetical protein